MRYNIFPLLQQGSPPWGYPPHGKPLCWPPPCVPVGEYLPIALFITAIVLAIIAIKLKKD